MFPGTMGAAVVVVDLFGADRVDPGSWPGPVYVYGVTDDELEAAGELLGELGLKIERER
jgi:hypothetical protein